MDRPTIKSKKGPEAIIQEKIVDKLRRYEWTTFRTHGNEYQSGFPDLYAMHRTYGARWIEVKNPVKYEFTPAQLKTFPVFQSCGVGVWVLTSDDDSEIKKLHGPANWFVYLL